MPQKNENKTGAGHIDLGKVLLPKKEKPGETRQSAQRINAGVLFEQEQRALEEPPLPQTQEPQPVSAPASKPKQERPLVKPLQTYQGDIASLVDEKNISVVSIAAAEADRRGKSVRADQAPINQEGSSRLGKTLMLAASFGMLAAAGGIGFYIYLRMQPVEPAARAQAPFILVDDALTVEVRPGDSRSEYVRALVAAKDRVSLSLGLMARLRIVKPSVLGDGSAQDMGAPEFLQALVPSVPAELLRTLEPQMLLGVHSYDENQAFMILKADSYETAYAGMLAWELSMRNDLAPLFTRTPAVRPRAPVPATPLTPLSPGTGAATATLATTTASTTWPGNLPTQTQDPAPQFFKGSFVDHVVDNRDGRAILGEGGDVLLLWTFLDRSTIVITTNAATLREIISRLSQANVLSLPSAQ